MYRNIIWDLDGTLFDTYPAMIRAFHAALADFDKTTKSSCIEKRIKVSIERCTAVMAARFSLDEDALGQAFSTHYKAEKAEEQYPFPGVKSVCETVLSRGGKNVIVTHRGRASAARLVEAHAMSGFFAGCLTNDDGYPRKPDPAAFISALQLFDLKPSETLTVGDRDIDVQAGQAAGLFTCLFASESDHIEADLKVDNYDQLYGFLFTQFNLRH